MYTDKKDGIFDSTSAVSLASAAVVKKFAPFRSISLRRVGFGVTTATVSTGGIVVTVKKYVTLGSATGASSIATITVPAGTAAGKVIYKNISPEKLGAGDELVFEVTTAAAGGGAAGAGICMFEAEDCPEHVANNADMVASA